ncbi:ribonuclease III family protein [Patulibacter sp.]|uniref:ribonuclease III family protein n=1 Tax=Patulibacter sp. TaxID=1912859 RepID=UPI00272072D9|nr:ribonuclease III domain-containing protein [Patulibacter sp.]MDO9409951.1 ribonuclease III domain-containing protein [Patulibacter sp.]
MPEDVATRPLRELLDGLPESARRPVLSHSSWTSRRSDSYERLAFLGDSVLELAVSTHLFRSLEAERFGAGRLTEVRAGTVSAAPCRRVAERLEVPRRMAEVAPDNLRRRVADLTRTERVLASVCEAIIGACYLEYGYARTAEAVVAAFAPELEGALDHPADHKSRLQERLMARGQTVQYRVTDEIGSPHDRTFVVDAVVEDAVVGSGRGRSKKLAEQEAAREALGTVEP